MEGLGKVPPVAVRVVLGGAGVRGPELADEEAGEAGAVGLEGEAGVAEGGGVVGEGADGEAGEEAEGAVESGDEGAAMRRP